MTLVSSPLPDAYIKTRMGRTWDYWSHNYDGGGIYGLRDAADHQLWRTALAGLVSSQPQTVADVGSGTGQVSLLLAELGHRVHSFDLSQGMVAMTRRKAGAGLTVTQADAERLPLLDQTVDVLVNRLVFWTLPHPLAALHEWQRVVKPGGRVVVIDGLWWQRATPWQTIQTYLSYVKVFNAARRRGTELATDAEAICVASIRLMWLEALYACVVGVAIGVGSAVSVGVGALHVAEGTLTAANLLLILLLVSECFRPVRLLQQAFHQAFWVTSVTDSIFSPLDAPLPVTERQPPQLEIPALNQSYALKTSPLPMGPTASQPCATSRFRSARVNGWRWSGDPVRARARWSICCCASMTRNRGGSRWAGWTSATCRWRRCAARLP